MNRLINNIREKESEVGIMCCQNKCNSSATQPMTIE